MSEDKRKEDRTLQQIEFYVFVDECNENQELVGEAFDCKASDVSAHGLKILCEEALYENNILNITIGAGESFSLYMLKGEVRWTKKADTGFQVGVQLVADEMTDYDRWIEDFESIFSSESEEPEDELDAFLREIED